MSGSHGITFKKSPGIDLQGVLRSVDSRRSGSKVALEVSGEAFLFVFPLLFLQGAGMGSFLIPHRQDAVENDSLKFMTLPWW